MWCFCVLCVRRRAAAPRRAAAAAGGACCALLERRRRLVSAGWDGPSVWSSSAFTTDRTRILFVQHAARRTTERSSSDRRAAVAPPRAAAAAMAALEAIAPLEPANACPRWSRRCSEPDQLRADDDAVAVDEAAVVLLAACGRRSSLWPLPPPKSLMLLALGLTRTSCTILTSALGPEERERCSEGRGRF